MDIFERLQAGEAVSFNDPEYPRIFEIVKRTLKLNTELNASGDLDRIRELMGEITGLKPDVSTTVFPPFYINLGIFTLLGKNVFINQGCSFLDIGGITIEDGVMIGPKVSVITEGHPLEITERNSLVVKPVIIKRNAWIGAGAIILPGVTIGENSVIAAGAVVRNDVPANTVVGGVPARVIKSLV